MIIDRVEIIHLRVPLKDSFCISSGDISEKDSVVLRVCSEGLIGYGEAPARYCPIYSYETTQTCVHILKDFLIPRILNKDIEDMSLVEKEFNFIRGHNVAKAGLERALWDILAQKMELPLYKLVGGNKDSIPVGVSIGIQNSVPELLGKIEGFLNQGYQRIKAKIKPGWDINVVDMIRKEFGNILLMVDANAAYSLEDIHLLQKLDERNLLMIEQPLGWNDLINHATLQKRLRTAICLDESIKDLDDTKAAVKLGSCKIINVKSPRVGGLLQAKKIHDFCLRNNIPTWCGDMLELGIGAAHNIAIASLPGFNLQNDIAPSNRYFIDNIINPRIVLNKDGTIHVPQNIGLGFEVDDRKIQKFTVTRITID